MKRCTTTTKPKTLLLILQSSQFILFRVRELILYQIKVTISKKFFHPMTLCASLIRRTSWAMKTLIAVILSTLKLRQKPATSIENEKTIPDPNPNAFQVTTNIAVLLCSSIPLISFEPVQFLKHQSSCSYIIFSKKLHSGRDE